MSTAYADDVTLLERIFALLDEHTTEMPADVWREPAENYESAERFARELALLRSRPQVLVPSAALADPGTYYARDCLGVPIVGTRDRDGALRAFLNSCRHRGTAVADGCGAAPSLACPFHGWVYGLDGRLRHIPHREGFPGVDPDAHGLREVACIEHGGLVLVDLAPLGDGRADLLAQWTAPLPDLAGHALLRTSEAVIPANWKIFVEGFLEGYHISATHRQTFLPFGYDNVNVLEFSGENSRVTFPFRRVERLRDRPRDEWRLDGMVTLVQLGFPNTVVAELSAHTTLVVIEPIDVRATRAVTFQLAEAQPDRVKGHDANRDVEFVDTGAAEDRAMAIAVQRGLATHANTHLTFGRFEAALGHFHRSLSGALDHR